MLLAARYAFGGTIRNFTLASASLHFYMVVLSSLAFSLWSHLLKHNRVSTVTAFNFMVPIFCVVLSVLFLGESIFSLMKAIALVLVSLGIWLMTRPTH